MSDTLKKTKSASSKSVAPRRVRAERDRLHFRVDARIKARAEEAALLLGQDLSTFAESALDEKAQAVIAREEKLVLSKRDFALFLDAIDNPKPANSRLQDAAQGFKTVRRENPELNW